MEGGSGNEGKQQVHGKDRKSPGGWRFMEVKL